MHVTRLDSVAIRVRVFELCGLGGDACSFFLDSQGGNLKVSESRGKVGRCFPIPWPVRQPVQIG